MGWELVLVCDFDPGACISLGGKTVNRFGNGVGVRAGFKDRFNCWVCNAGRVK